MSVLVELFRVLLVWRDAEPMVATDLHLEDDGCRVADAIVLCAESQSEPAHERQLRTRSESKIAIVTAKGDEGESMSEYFVLNERGV